MKGICFKEPMFKAVVNGTKTTTCREVVPNNKSAKIRYSPGDILFLKEPYIDDLDINRIFYKFDLTDEQEVEQITDISNPWKNKLFMPESAARYFIKVVSVTSFPLSSFISENIIDLDGFFMEEGIQQDDTGFHYGTNQHFRTAMEAFINLWDSINGRGAYDKNPFVRIYRFELLKN